MCEKSKILGQVGSGRVYIVRVDSTQLDLVQLGQVWLGRLDSIRFGSGRVAYLYFRVPDLTRLMQHQVLEIFGSLLINKTRYFEKFDNKISIIS